MITIAVDAHGGDYAPNEIIKGVIKAVEENNDIEILLVGVKEKIKPILDTFKIQEHKKIKLIESKEIIGMADNPVTSIRRKKNSSIHIGLKLVKEKKASSFFSAGNTGAVMATAKLILNTLEGVERPAIATIMPNITGHFVMLDVGANIQCKPIHYIQFAIMGSIYSKIMLHKNNPRVGLLSIGEEAVKGNDLLKTVHTLLNEMGVLNFIGNVEAKELFRDTCDVVVTDGFTGNIALKTSESAAWYISTLLKEELSKNIPSKIAALLAKPVFKRLKKRADYEEYGGALLIGVDGITIIGHGSSNAYAVKNAIGVAKELAKNNINQKITEQIYSIYGDLLKTEKYSAFWHNLKERIKNMTLKHFRE
ncbi:MAG: phosphate acyltransferase PlsX [Deferribacterota bacterium]|nr:phosphate acyltransferase PlsX [Deferribacterota bacterium]